MQVHDTSLTARMQQVAPGDTAPARVVARYQVGGTLLAAWTHKAPWPCSMLPSNLAHSKQLQGNRKTWPAGPLLHKRLHVARGSCTPAQGLGKPNSEGGDRTHAPPQGKGSSGRTSTAAHGTLGCFLGRMVALLAAPEQAEAVLRGLPAATEQARYCCCMPRAVAPWPCKPSPRAESVPSPSGMR